MLIRVILPTGKFDYVKSSRLQDFIDQRQIVSFRRTSGWVILGKDPVRVPKTSGYPGLERRRIDIESRAA